MSDTLTSPEAATAAASASLAQWVPAPVLAGELSINRRLLISMAKRRLIPAPLYFAQNCVRWHRPSVMAALKVRGEEMLRQATA